MMVRETHERSRWVLTGFCMPKVSEIIDNYFASNAKLDHLAACLLVALSPNPWRTPPCDGELRVLRTLIDEGSAIGFCKSPNDRAFIFREYWQSSPILLLAFFLPFLMRFILPAIDIQHIVPFTTTKSANVNLRCLPQRADSRIIYLEAGECFLPLIM